MTQLAEVAIKEYAERRINFQPMYPAVLVRVLPKEHMTSGGLFVPDTAQNKPVYEGIVLRTYPPKRIQLDSGKWITMDSGLEAGQHILFPHWSGEKVDEQVKDYLGKSLDPDEYRMIPARGILSLAGMRDSGEPFLILNYEKENVDEKLLHILALVYKAGYEDGKVHDYDKSGLRGMVDKIKKEFDILVKVQASKTHSGE